MTHSAVEQTLNSLRDVDPRNAAEYAYALAMLNKQEGNETEAVRFGRDAVALFNQCQMDTLDDCAARNTVIEGVVIPDLIHQDVVRNRLQPLVL